MTYHAAWRTVTVFSFLFAAALGSSLGSAGHSRGTIERRDESLVAHSPSLLPVYRKRTPNINVEIEDTVEDPPVAMRILPATSVLTNTERRLLRWLIPRIISDFEWDGNVSPVSSWDANISRAPFSNCREGRGGQTPRNIAMGWARQGLFLHIDVEHRGRGVYELAEPHLRDQVIDFIIGRLSRNRFQGTLYFQTPDLRSSDIHWYLSTDQPACDATSSTFLPRLEDRPPPGPGQAGFNAALFRTIMKR